MHELVKDCTYHMTSISLTINFLIHLKTIFKSSKMTYVCVRVCVVKHHYKTSVCKTISDIGL